MFVLPYRTVQADPAWAYRDKLRMSKTRRSSTDQYRRTMTTEEICAMYTPSQILGRGETISPSGRVSKVADVVRPGRLLDYPIADEGFLWLWATAAVLLDGTAVDVCRRWGYEPAQLGVWIKGRIGRVGNIDIGGETFVDVGLILQIGMGWALRNAAEFFIIGTRGTYTKLIKDKGQSNVILQPEESIILANKREHSRKPDAAYDTIERVFPGPYLELFAKYRRPGWTQNGDELEAWPDTPIEWP